MLLVAALLLLLLLLSVLVSAFAFVCVSAWGALSAEGAGEEEEEMI